MPDGQKESRTQYMPDPAGRDLGSMELEDTFEAPPSGYTCDSAGPADITGVAQPFSDFMRDLDVCLKALEAEDSPEAAAGVAGQPGRYQPFDAPGGWGIDRSPVPGEAFQDAKHAAKPPAEGARSFQELWHDLEVSLNRQPRPR
jgi:hypothetical protein